MWKAVWTCIVIVLFSCNSSKISVSSNDTFTDSLKHYSYLLALCVPKGNSCNLSGMSTGFFIKDGKTIYLVSAYHVFTQTNTTSDKPSFFIHRRMLVRLGNQKDNLFINLETVKNWGKKISLYNTPDIYFYKTDINPDSVKVFSIENILTTNRNTKHTEKQVLSYGYLNKATDTTNIYTYPALIYKGQIANPADYSSVSYFKNIDSLYLVSKPKTFDGTSGSPVFLKYSKGNNKSTKEWIEFAGIMVATDSTTNCTVILKKEYFISEFEKFKKSMR